jgi:hypothetical protein
MTGGAVGVGWTALRRPGQTPRQSRLADKRRGPALLQQLRFGHHAVAMFQEVEQDLEDFRFEGQAMRPVPHLPAGRISRVVMKTIHHMATVLPYLSNGLSRHQP